MNGDVEEFDAGATPAALDTVQPSRHRTLSNENLRDDQDPASEDSPGSLQRSCDEYRNELLNKPISQVDLNISAVAPTPQQRGPAPTVRSWTDANGQGLGEGTLIDLHRGSVVIQTEQGIRRIPLARLSDADLAAVAEFWVVPSECTLGERAAVERSWLPQTVTWKASNLCHKTLYFQDVQLERYGHDAGPLLQPVVSTAHFFVQVAGWPYATALHPPNECRYALGYYRPGNCAPWLVDPFPISLRGAARQTAAVFAAGSLLR